ncbi:Tetratricopeptide repeat-containing protein [Pseudomonas chlororaphis]|uniref:tetratricopeptide repeat protein n=1 Tax=Pseudomonas chlororaphis TaxID=587753 RepID=UPI00087D10AA|nr:tetratricopeptide repeat protein [Pseudomonas chlororaphis]AZD64236.1 TPR domain protein [Pseudomonas chlororaphis subsp. aurantiaca]QIT20448.1 tetratricopeptide repeat protein [Pseudomonas chlororaphis subsp. aurantiaca]WDH04595.1 tetratricopeptide repeat protein [Pseudomonas chlororaphis]WDH12650.1 tetratricopeptide repeat protein [Pseudomonas chlororaphis]SDT67174.1 Tetratricopeptide repeat-containing protein [Pseudomonas chlororaphis]
MRLFRVTSIFSLWALAFSVTAQQLPVEVLSAVVKDQKIADAEVLVQRNGAQSVVGRTNAQGQVTLTTDFADDPSNLLIIKKPGYSNLVVKCPCSGMTYAISPVMQNLDGLRVVLTWGATPSDLDSHMIFPGNNIYFRNQQGEDAHLDVDDIDGYGPETITLEKKHYGESYVYAVHDYSNQTRPESRQFAASQAKVFVYMGQSLVRTYYVPQDRSGNLWTVFRMTGNGDFQDINTLSGVTVDAQDVLNEVSPLLDDKVEVAAVAVSSSAQADAKTLNRKGEEAYHAGNLQQAIDFYRQAIELNNGYGQAYSNLGLAYQKAGNTAESIWANRKAIALASGSSAATVRASSYYNIARIYEAAGQFADALRHYQLAKQQKANPVYDKAIERVQNR